MSKKQLVVLSGISGAGKSTALFPFEEMGYYSVQRMPSFLFDSFFESINDENSDFFYEKIVLVIDLSVFKIALEKLKNYPNIDVSTILLYADKEEIFKRYKLTRHSHPLQVNNLTLDQALDIEYEAFREVYQLSNFNVNTTTTNVTELRKIIFERFSEKIDGKGVAVKFISFGFKNGQEKEADLIFDLRLIPNPYYHENLTALSGKDRPVMDFLEAQEETKLTMDHIINYLDFYLPQAVNDNRGMVVVALACTGGQHRSVYFAEQLSKHYKGKYRVFTFHRDLKKK